MKPSIDDIDWGPEPVLGSPLLSKDEGFITVESVEPVLRHLPRHLPSQIAFEEMRVELSILLNRKVSVVVDVVNAEVVFCAGGSPVSVCLGNFSLIRERSAKWRVTEFRLTLQKELLRSIGDPENLLETWE